MGLFDDRTKLHGTMQKFWFRGHGGFAVGQFRLSETGEQIAVRGALAELAEGQPVELTGQFEEHPRYGYQFRVDAIEIERPQGRNAVQAYLASGLVKGVGPSLAGRIVETLGEDALEVIESEPRRLLDVPGIGEKKADAIRRAVSEQASLREVLLFLHGHGLPAGLAHKILEAWGHDAPRLLKNNPYRLAEDIVGVGFKRADDVAARLGIARDCDERKQAGLLFALSQAVTRAGHSCVPAGLLRASAADYLQLAEDSLEGTLDELAAARRVIVQSRAGDDDPFVYPLTLHVAEKGLAAAVLDLITRRAEPLVRNVDGAIELFESQARFVMPDAQREAVRAALSSAFCVITGGPGVGKTTIVRALTAIADRAGKKVALAAPTGRAAKRLSEATGRPASTIHRLLEFQSGTGRFVKGPRDRIDAELLVVDETSMLDLPLAYGLLRAVGPTARVVFVGDVDQLPSVGPGRVLEDLIRCGRIPVVRLTRIFRQQEGSLIVRNAHRILAGQVPEMPARDHELSDFYFIEQSDAEQCLDTIVQLVTDRIPQRFGLDPIRDVQVLCPMYRGPLGVDSINDRLGRLLVRGDAELVRGARRFRTGDKVLQIRNNYDLDLFNGDPGRVIAIDVKARSIHVSFSGRRVELSGDALDQIVPAYGITVHRAQGSEYSAVVMTLDPGHFLLLNRRLLYTAVTRAKRLLVLIGSRSALERAVRTDDESGRFSGLLERISPPETAPGPGGARCTDLDASSGSRP